MMLSGQMNIAQYIFQLLKEFPYKKEKDFLNSMLDDLLLLKRRRIWAILNLRILITSSFSIAEVFSIDIRSGCRI